MTSHHHRPNDCPPASRHGPVHRIAAVRQRLGLSARTVAQRLGTTIGQVLLEEDEHTDLPLSRLYQWQEALRVPLRELLVDANAPLALPVLEEARMARVMDLATAILQETEGLSVGGHAQTLMEQLVEIMPELREAERPSPLAPGRSPGDWPSGGQNATGAGRGPSRKGAAGRDQHT